MTLLIKRASFVLCLFGLAAPLTFGDVSFPLEGTVGEVVRDSAYTYVRVDHGEASCWVATVAGPYRAGASVGVEDGVAMDAYTSDELNRTFDEIVFSDQVVMRSSGAIAMPVGHGAADLPPGHPPIPGRAPSQEASCPVSHENSEPAEGTSGTIMETMDAAGYTYIQVKTADGAIWAATSAFDAKVGDTVVIPEGMVMKNFESQTLGRTFDEIYFVDKVFRSEGGDASSKADGGACCPAHETASGALQIEVPEGGLTVSDLYERREELAGQKAVVRGNVVRVSKNIMGKNWMHVDDGTLPGSDLTVTTSEDGFETGEVVTLSGTVAVDVNIGPHYDYPLILEDAVSVR